jgi:multidrug efflux pump subunit AcrA (membrane-fusion protein)
MALCLLLLTAACAAQDENVVVHHLEGLQKQIDQADKDLEDRKKELHNDPSLQPLEQNLKQAKTAADAFYASSNNKYQNGTAELAQAQTQQQSLDAAAKNAREALIAARNNLLMNDPGLKDLAGKKADLVGQRNQILAEARIKGMLMGLGCASSLTPQTPIAAAKTCLDELYDGKDPRLSDALPTDGNGQVSRGTPLFNTIKTSSGPATIGIDLPVNDPAWSDIKRAIWQKGLAEHQTPEQIYQTIETQRKAYEQQAPSKPPALILNTPRPSTTNYIEVPPPAAPATPPSVKEVFDRKMQDMINRLQKMVEPIREMMTPDVAAVRG